MNQERGDRWFSIIVLVLIISLAIFLFSYLAWDVYYHLWGSEKRLSFVSDKLDLQDAVPTTDMYKTRARQLTVEEVEAVGPMFSRIEQFIEIKKDNPLVLSGDDFKKSLSDEFDPGYFDGVKLFRICFYDSTDRVFGDIEPFVAFAFLFDQETSANLCKRSLLRDLKNNTNVSILRDAIVFYKGKVVGVAGMLWPERDKSTAGFKELIYFVEEKGFNIVDVQVP